MPQAKFELPKTRTVPGSSNNTASSPTAERHAAIDRALHEAALLHENWTPIVLRQILGLDPETLSLLGSRMHLFNITGDIKDPVEKMLVQQFTIAHHRLMQLHERASSAQDLEGVKVFNAAAARLQGELRRLALAIRQYRAPISTRTFTVVEQQNVATKQEVTYVAQGADHKKLHSRDIELGSKPQETGHDGTFNPDQEPQPGAGRLREQGILEGLHAGRA